MLERVDQRRERTVVEEERRCVRLEVLLDDRELLGRLDALDDLLHGPRAVLVGPVRKVMVRSALC